ncbi:MAG: hypothetical protein ACXABD_20775 [Candidatus Thorarchaeota archaeon]|jgi:hypothetical protein
MTNETKLPKIVFNDHTRVWIISYAGDPPNAANYRYGTFVTVKDLQIELNQLNIHLVEQVTQRPGTYSSLISFFREGMTVQITECEVGRPDHYENNDPIVTLNDCIFVNSWIDDLVAPEASRVSPVLCHLILKSYKYEWRKDD